MKSIIAILALTVATGVMAQAAKHPDPEKMAAAAKKDVAKKAEPKKEAAPKAPPSDKKPTPKKKPEAK